MSIRQTGWCTGFPPRATTTSSWSESHQGCFLEGAGDNVLHVYRSMPAQLATQLAEVDHYNRDYQQRHADGHLGAHDSLIAGLPPEVPEPERAALRFIDTQYGKADALAIYYQRRSDRLFGLFGVMTFAMGLSYLIYERLTESRVLLVAYLVVLLGSLALYYMFAGKHWFAKHLTYRALAETLRIKLYLRLAGVDHRVDAGEVLALSGVDRFRGFSWVSYVLKAVTASDLPRAAAAPCQLAPHALGGTGVDRESAPLLHPQGQDARAHQLSREAAEADAVRRRAAGDHDPVPDRRAPARGASARGAHHCTTC